MNSLWQNFWIRQRRTDAGWRDRHWPKGAPGQWGSSATAAPPTPAAAPLPAARCGTCQNFRNDPAWVAGVFSGFPGLGSGFASACAADGICRLTNRLRSAAFSCLEFQR